MRAGFLSILLFLCVGSNAQTNQQEPKRFTVNNKLKDSAIPKKWFVTKYVGISSGISFFNGGNATILSVPVGIQLNRRISNNWYAFAGLSVAPSYVNFNGAFLNNHYSKSGQPYSFGGTQFNMYSRAELGLMYTNDQKTFSISGSISVDRSNNPLIPYSQFGGSGQRLLGLPHQ